MDKLSESVKDTPGETLSFLNHIFNFDDDNKNEMLNMFQYAIMSIIPIVIILKAVKHLIPDEDESKGNLEITLEIVGQLILIIGLLWFSDKTIRYFPTYSGNNYHTFYPTNYLLPFILILATMQTKFGSKLNIMIDRSMILLNGKTTEQSENQNEPVVNQHQPSQADHLVDNTNLLPSNRNLTAMPQQPQQNNVDFSNMYANAETPLVDALEPMAANEGFGGSTPW